MEERESEGCTGGVAEEDDSFKGRESGGNAPWSADESAVWAALELGRLVEAEGEARVGFDVKGYCSVEGLFVAGVVGNSEGVCFDEADAGDTEVDVLAGFPAEAYMGDGDFGEIAWHRLEVRRVAEGFAADVLEYVPCESTELVKGDKGDGHPDVVRCVCGDVEV